MCKFCVLLCLLQTNWYFSCWKFNVCISSFLIILLGKNSKHWMFQWKYTVYWIVCKCHRWLIYIPSRGLMHTGAVSALTWRFPWPNDQMTWLTDDLTARLTCWQTQALPFDGHSIPAVETTGQASKKQSLIIMIAARAIFSLGVHMHTAPGRGHDLEVSLCGFIVSLQPCFLPHCIPTELLIWAFIKWVHRHSAGAPALVSHRPSAGSKSPIYLCYEGHVERTMGVALRDALRDNCLTILWDLW